MSIRQYNAIMELLAYGYNSWEIAVSLGINPFELTDFLTYAFNLENDYENISNDLLGGE